MSDQSIGTICCYQELKFGESFPKQNKKCCNIFSKHKEKKKKAVGLIMMMLKTVLLLWNKEFQVVPGKSVVIVMMLQSNWKYPVMETMMET